MSNLESNLKKILRGKKACNPGDYLKVPKFRKNLPQEMKPGKGKVLGEGLYGKVYRGSVNDNGRRYVAYKEIDTKKNDLGMAAFEYKVAKKLKGYGVPDMYLYKKCKGMDILYLEYVKGDELHKWWKTKPSINEIKSVMTQILYNLYRIKKKFPGFRHHDLHRSNILVRSVPVKKIEVKLLNKTYTISNGGVEAVMIDFGLSLFPKLANPAINDGGLKSVGISRKSHHLYDLHLFLNTIFTLVKDPQNTEERQVFEFIKSIIPEGHRGMANKYVTQYRLGPNMDANHNKSLPSFEQVLSKPFFTGESQVNKIVKRVVRRPKPAPLVIVTKPKEPVNQANAMARAIAVMKAGREKKKVVQPLRKPGVVVKKLTPKAPVKEKEIVDLYMFTNMKGKEHMYKSKAWYEKALAKNRAARNRDISSATATAVVAVGEVAKLQLKKKLNAKNYAMTDSMIRDLRKLNN